MPHQIPHSKKEDCIDNPVIAVPWKISDTAMACALVVVGFLTIFATLQILTDITNSDTELNLTPWLIAFYSAAEGLMVLAVWIFAIKKYRIRWRKVGLTTPSNSVHWSLSIMAVIMSLAFSGAYVAIINFIGIDALIPTAIPSETLGHGLSRIFNIAAIIIWAPFAEELFFRGFFLVSLIPLLGPLRASIVSAAIFAIVHLSLATMIPILITGLIFSWLYLRTRSIWYPIAAHAIQNLIAISVVL
jgi:membrane protease YdiL (CAAX protease family)